MLIIRQKSIGIIFLAIFMLSGCTGGCTKKIDLRKESNPSTVTQTIHNVTRTDLLQVPWLVSELENFVANITNSNRWTISEENYTLLRNVFIDLDIIKDNTATSGAGSAIDSSITYLMRFYLRFEGVVVELKVESLCGT